MGQLALVVEIAIEEGRLEDFKAAAKGYIERTQSEAGTLRYDWHISEDGARCVNLEVFEDAAAFMVHDDHVADLGSTMEGIGAIDRFLVIGDVTDATRRQLEDKATGYYGFFKGISR